MRIITTILRRLYALLTRGPDDSTHISAPEEVLKLSKVHLDLRNPQNRKYVEIGKDSFIDVSCIFETSSGFIKIADRVFIGGATLICRSSIQIDENVQIAWGCLLYDHNAHSFDYRERRKDIDVFLANKKAGRDVLKNEGKDWDVVHTAPIHIGHDAWIGADVTILSGVTVGEGAIVGAGSVVRDDIPAWSIAYGNPCRAVTMNRYRPQEDKDGKYDL